MSNHSKNLIGIIVILVGLVSGLSVIPSGSGEVMAGVIIFSLMSGFALRLAID